MKWKITKGAFEKLSDDLKLEYKADGDHYVLQVEGQPSEEGSAALKNALDREKAENADLREQLKGLNTKLTEAEKKVGEGDQAAQREVDRLKKKIEGMETEHKTKLDAKDTAIANSHRDTTVNALAAKISTSPAVIAPHIKDRLEVTIDPDTNLPKVSIKGKDGKIDAALTIDKLGEEFVANPDFRGIIRGSGASGTRPPAGVSGAPQAGFNPSDKPLDLATAKGADLVNHMRQVHAAKSGQAGGTP